MAITPTALRNVEEIVRSCKGCQFYAKQTHLSAQALQTIPITWPFAVWGLDMVGPLKKAPGGFIHLLVAIDKFTKWIEAKPITTIDSKEAISWTSCRDSAYPTPSSPTTGPISQVTTSKSSQKDTGSGLIGHRSDTRARTGK